MVEKDARRAFKEADALYRAGRHQDAQRLLTQLDQAYPHRKNILYPLALCMAKLGQVTEAERLCDQLIAEFHDPRAEKLKARMVALHDPESQPFDADAFSPQILDDVTAPAPPLAPAKPAQKKKRFIMTNRVRYSLIAAAVLAFLIVVPLLLWLLL